MNELEKRIQNLEKDLEKHNAYLMISVMLGLVGQLLTAIIIAKLLNI